METSHSTNFVNSAIITQIKTERSFITDHDGNLNQTYQFVYYKTYHKFELVNQFLGVN